MTQKFHCFTDEGDWHMEIKHLFNRNKRKTKQGDQKKVQKKPCAEDGMFLLASKLDKENYDDHFKVIIIK